MLRALLAAGEDVDLVVSRASRLTILDETGHPFRDAHAQRPAPLAGPRRRRHPRTRSTPDLEPAYGTGPPGTWPRGPRSGSYPVRGMLIVPASTACVAGVALGLSKDLLQRTASVTLKERRPLVVAVRETPLNGQTLRHLVTLDEAGAVVLPASPAFYAGARHIQDLVDFVAGRVLDAAGRAAQAVPPLGGRARAWGIAAGEAGNWSGQHGADALDSFSGLRSATRRQRHPWTRWTGSSSRRCARTAERPTPNSAGWWGCRAPVSPTGSTGWRPPG